MTSASTAPAPTGTRVPSNPFVGPRALAFGEPFFGRDTEVTEIRDLLSSERILVLFAPSGAGKTSLMEAGLREQLAKRKFRVAPTIRVGSTLPPDQTTDITNRFVLGTVLSLEPPAEDVQSPSAPIQTTLAEAFARYDAKEPDDPDPCFIFDQFEELFILDPTDVDSKQEFMEELGTALEDRGRWAIFAVRQDVLGELDRFADLVPTGFDQRYRLGLLTTDAATAAIVRTAARQQVTLDESDLVRPLVDNLAELRDESGASARGRYVEPLLLQVVCHRRWPDLALGRLDAVDAEGGAGVDAALAEYFEEAVHAAAEQPGVTEADIRIWFDELISDDGVRKPTRRGPSNAAPGTLEGLVHAHLVRRNEQAGAIWYELADDRLVEPVQRSNADWRAKNVPLERAELWGALGKPKRLLLAGSDLDRAKEWDKSHPQDLDALQREFLDRSIRRGRVVVIKAVMIGAAVLVVALWLWARDQEQEAKRRVESARLVFEAINASDPLTQPRTWIEAYEALAGERADPFLERQLTSAAHHLEHDPAYVAAAGDLSPDGRRIARATTDGRVELVAVDDPTRRQLVTRGLGRVTDIAFGPRGDHVVVAAERSDGDFVVGVWSVGDSEEPLWLDDEPDGEVSGLVVGSGLVAGLVGSPDGAGEQSVMLWDLLTGQRSAQSPPDAARVLVGPSVDRLVLSTVDDLEVVPTIELQGRMRLRKMARGDVLLAVDDGARRAVVASEETASLYVLDLERGAVVPLEPPSPGGELAGPSPFVAATFAGDRVVAMDQIGRVSAWSIAGGQLAVPEVVATLPVGSIDDGVEVDFDRAGTRALFGDRGRRSLAVWDLAGRPISPTLGDRRVPPAPRGTFDQGGFLFDEWRYEMWGTAAAAATDPEGSFVAAANSEGGVVVWDHHTHEETARFFFDEPVDRLLLGDDKAVAVLGEGLSGGTLLRIYDKDDFVHAGREVPAPTGGLELFVGGLVNVELDVSEQSLRLTESDGYVSELSLDPDIADAAADARSILDAGHP